MTMDIFTVITVGFSYLFILAGFVAGRVYERIQWNKLIRARIIPAPRSSRRGS